jgi:hypothetical protein
MRSPTMLWGDAVKNISLRACRLVTANLALQERLSMKPVAVGALKISLLTVVLLCSGCAVVAVVDTVVVAGATVVKTAVKATGAVIDTVIPEPKK